MRGQQSPCGRAIQAPVPLTAPLQHPRPQPQGLGPAGPRQQHLDLEGKGGGQVCLISRVPPGPESCLSRILSLRPSPPAPWGVMQDGLEGATGGGRGSRPAGLRRGGAEVRSVGLEAPGHGAGSWKRKWRAGAPGSWAVPLLGGRASRCWLFWKPARVARHMGWLPGARVPGDLLVTSFWDIRLLAAPALFPWARAQGSCLGLPWGPPGGWLRLLHQTSKGLSFPASPPTAPGGHGGQAVGGH